MNDEEKKMMLLERIDEKLGSINLNIQIVLAIVLIIGGWLLFRH
jgi:hypothetical protein